MAWTNQHAFPEHMQRAGRSGVGNGEGTGLCSERIQQLKRKTSTAETDRPTTSGHQVRNRQAETVRDLVRGNNYGKASWSKQSGAGVWGSYRQDGGRAGPWGEKMSTNLKFAWS